MDKAGIYLSVPFCRQKCSYCNFASEVHPFSQLPRYLHALQTEITNRARLWRMAGIASLEDGSVNTIYLGGGTPGLIEPEALRELIGTVRSCFSVDEEAEITLEASPENVTIENAHGWASYGVNRVSMGVQSMVERELRAVGRRHTAETVGRAFSVLKQAGICNLSVDLIAGLPRQTEQSWETSLEALLRLEPPHFSIYMLEVDDDSRLGSEILKHGQRYRAAEVPSEEQVAAFYSAAAERLRADGYEHYEVSNFARRGKASLHNEKYWTGAPYFGFGVDAHSYDGERRWANADSLEHYLEKIAQAQPPVVDLKTLSAQEKLEERFFLGLRQRQGIRASRLNSDFDVDVHQKYSAQIHQFREAGWL
ncbi:MAG: radical SAM family heme chaperone HemW, partial [Acidobacteriota bacterium]